MYGLLHGQVHARSFGRGKFSFLLSTLARIHPAVAWVAAGLEIEQAVSLMV